MATPAIPEAGTLPWLDRYTSTSGEIMTEVGVTQAQLLEFGREWERRCWPILAEEVETLRAEVVRRVPKQREGCCRAAVDSDGQAHDHADWYGDLVRAHAAHDRMARWIEALRRDREQAESDLAALHAEAARLRAALDLAERDKAHALVDELMAERNAALDQRDQWKYNAGIWENNRAGWHRRALEAEAERDALRPVVEALAELVRLKGGPRGPDYEQRKPIAWQTARDVLAAVDQMAPSRPHVPPQSDDRGEVAGGQIRGTESLKEAL